MNKKINPRGFTLLESLFSAMLIGLVIAALAASSSAFTMANAAGVDLSTAEFLIEEIREWTTPMAFDDLLDLDGSSVLIDAAGQPMDAAFSVFTQQIAVAECGTEFSAPEADFVRITVTILKNANIISQADWIRANLE